MAKFDKPKSKLIRHNEKGASMVEYALIAVLIAIVCVAGVTVLGTQTSAKFSSIASGVASN